MSLPKPDLHLRICELADARLEMLAASSRRTKTDIASELVEEALLGRGHALIMAVEAYRRAGFDGKRGD